MIHAIMMVLHDGKRWNRHWFMPLVVLLCVQAFVVQPMNAAVSPFLRTRSQSVNGPRRVTADASGIMYGYVPEEQRWDSYDTLVLGEFSAAAFDAQREYLSFSVMPTFQKCFRGGSIAQWLFGDTLTPYKKGGSVQVQGYYADNKQFNDGVVAQPRDSNAWLADNFYLPQTFNGTLCFEPHLMSSLVDFSLYARFDRWCSGLYGRLYAPFVYTKSSIMINETILSVGTDSLQPVKGNTAIGFFGPAKVDNNKQLSSASDYFSGRRPPVLTQPLQATSPLPTVTIERNPLEFHKMGCPVTVCGFGEIRGECGKLWEAPWRHVGLYGTFALPTGPRITAEHLFGPVAGNGGHAELGMGGNGHWIFWYNVTEDHQIGMYADIMITHMFGAPEQRVFDLKGKPLSRYMLAARHRPVAQDDKNALRSGDGMVARYQFDDEFTPVANITAQRVTVSIGVQCDATAWLSYTMRGLHVDLGYNLWALSKESISSCNQKCGPRLRTEENTWALKGDARVYGFRPVDSAVEPTRGIPLPVSERDATITSGTFPSTSMPPVNGGVDNRKIVQAHDSTADDPIFVTHDQVTTSAAAAMLPSNQVYASFGPDFLSDQDIDVRPQCALMTHKLFAHCSYAHNRPGVVPFIGVGGEVEFGGVTDCNGRGANHALSQWGIWFQLGCALN